ncbi:MAG: hypothetical protein JXR41_10180 [Bacteroidales bacterium]|nr:hypothetical protein [Bacteroidales bacterium]MBN2763448.1 hypothetical protein [Bacteroidales bacterium]
MNKLNLCRSKKYILYTLFIYCSIITANAQHQKHLGISLGYNYAVPNSGEVFRDFSGKYSFTGNLFTGIKSNILGIGLDITSFNLVHKVYLNSEDYYLNRLYYNLFSPYGHYGYYFSIERFNIIPLINSGCAFQKAWRYDKKQLCLFLKPEVLFGYEFRNGIGLYLNLSYNLLFHNFGLYINSNIEEPETESDVTQYYAAGFSIAYCLYSRKSPCSDN